MLPDVLLRRTGVEHRLTLESPQLPLGRIAIERLAEPIELVLEPRKLFGLVPTHAWLRWLGSPRVGRRRNANGRSGHPPAMWHLVQR